MEQNEWNGTEHSLSENIVHDVQYAFTLVKCLRHNTANIPETVCRVGEEDTDGLRPKYDFFPVWRCTGDTVKVSWKVGRYVLHDDIQ